MNAKNTKSLPAKRILVMRYRFIGDTILTVPFLRNLRYHYPNAVIDVLVGPQSGAVLQGCPYINELITFDTTRFHKYDQGQTRSFWSYIIELRQRQYDTVFLLKRSLSSALLGFLIGARHRIGYNTQARKFLLTHPVPWDPNKHEVTSTLDVLSAANIKIIDDHLEAWLSEEEKLAILDTVPELTTTRPKALFHAAAAHPDKLYPLEHWATVIATLVNEYQILPFFIGSREDSKLYEELQELAGVRGIMLAGKLNLRQSMAVISGMDLVVSTDSGPAHLSAALHIPTISLFGPTDPIRWQPWGQYAIYDESLPCRPCHYKKVCDNRPCLTELSPVLVLEKCRQILGNAKQASV